jgi:hypothetical protein
LPTKPSANEICPIVQTDPSFRAVAAARQSVMDKTDLSLILSATSLVIAIAGNLTAAALVAAFLAGRLLAPRDPHRP